jgi:hypothetical protein
MEDAAAEFVAASGWRQRTAAVGDFAVRQHLAEPSRIILTGREFRPFFFRADGKPSAGRRSRFNDPAPV